MNALDGGEDRIEQLTGLGVALVGGSLQPQHGLGVVLSDFRRERHDVGFTVIATGVGSLGPTFKVETPEPELGGRVAPFGIRAQGMAESGSIEADEVGILARRRSGRDRRRLS